MKLKSSNMKTPRQLSCIALGYGMIDGEFESRQGLGIFLFTTASRPALELTQPHLHLLPRSKICGAIPPLPQHAFTAWCSVKSHGHLYLYLLPYFYFRHLPQHNVDFTEN
jgi:hypothetical protein